MELTYDKTIVGVEEQFSLRKFLYYTTLASLFSEALMLNLGAFRLQFSYLLLFFNLLMMLLLGQFSIPKKLLMLCLYLGASSAIGIANDTDTLALAGKQLAGIPISAFYFYNFFQLQENRFERAFRDYAVAAYWVAIVGFCMLPLQWAFHITSYSRFTSILPEPAHYATVCIPALYFFADQWLSYRRYGRQLAVMLLSFVFSLSAVAYLGIGAGIALLLWRYRFYVLIAPLLIGVMFVGLFLGSEGFRERVVDTAGALQESSVEGTNLSTFALVANMFVTEQVFEESPWLGNGLGSHALSHEKFLDQIPGIREFLGEDLEKLNAEDAASLLLRVISELGLVGLFGVLAFMWYFRVSGQGPRAQISYAILLYFFLKLLRHGHYFSPEQFFFILIYILNYKSAKSAYAERSQLL